MNHESMCLEKFSNNFQRIYLRIIEIPNTSVTIKTFSIV